MEAKKRTLLRGALDTPPGLAHMQPITRNDLDQTFGHLVQWDDDFVPTGLAEHWRHVGDPVCDAAVREVFSHPSSSVGKDLLQSIRDHVAAGSVEGSAAATFLNEVMGIPPRGICVVEEDVVIAQELFLDDSVQILQSLLHYSLAGGLSSSRIVRTLEAVSFLLPHIKTSAQQCSDPLASIVANISQASNDKTFIRIVETLQLILDVLGCTSSASAHVSKKSPHTFPISAPTAGAYLLPGGKGWESTVRVRLLHAIARWRVEERLKLTDLVIDSTPISQEEVAATLTGFSTIPMWCLPRFHIRPTSRQVEAYLALWRHVGFYLGVSPSILHHHFSSPDAVARTMTLTTYNLFFEVLPAAAPSTPRGPTLPVLIAVSNRPPLHTSLEQNIALTRYLLGPRLATHLGLPPTALRARIVMHAFLLAQCVPHYFARWYPRRAWLNKRRAVLREGIVRTMQTHLGMRRTAFRPRTVAGGEKETGCPGQWGRTTGAVAGEPRTQDRCGGGGGGELAPGVSEVESVRQEPDSRLSERWWEMIVEMVVVCAIACVLGGTVAVAGFRSAFAFFW